MTLSKQLVSLHLTVYVTRNGTALGPPGKLIGVVPESIIAMHAAASLKKRLREVVDPANNHGAARHLSSRVLSRQDCSGTKEVSTCRRSTYARMHRCTLALYALSL